MDNKIYTFTGRTKESAIQEAEKALNKDRKFLLVNVVEESTGKTMFNILDKNNVKIEVTINEEKENLLKKQEKRIFKLSEKEIQENINCLTTFMNNLNKLDIRNSFEYTITSDDSLININLESDEPASLIGKNGQNLNYIEIYLQNILRHNVHPCAKVIVDCNNYKEKKSKRIENLANNIALSILKTGKPITLEPMNSYDRKIIHNTILNYPELTTESVGVEPKRRVVISKVNFDKKN